ncbi:MAG: GAF domain-containing protein [Chloroflexi bacterium]|nr:GAF domain-containing protein [Chloroflexota bacterium]MBU1751403.1 GAF domain-containing protein [Chloroflexota bacterium]
MRARFSRFFSPPVFENPDKTRSARLLNMSLWACLFTMFTVVAIILLTIGIPDSPEEIFTVSSAVLMFGFTGVLLVIAKLGHTHTASVLFLSMLWVIITLWVCGVAGVSSDNSSLNYGLIIVVAGLLLGGRGALVYTFVCGLAILWAYYAESSGLLVVADSPVSIMDPLLLIVPLVLIGVLLRYAMNTLTAAVQRAQDNEYAQATANRELQAIRASLEDQVTERTQILERRTRYLEATAAVAQDAATMLDPGQLLQRIAAAIGEQFGFYRIGIFTIDPTGEWAILRAATDEAGRQAMTRGFRLRVGQEGIVGYVTRSGQAYVAHQVQEDELFLADPAIADIGSEAVLPLRTQGQVIGALDVQSTEAHAFSTEDMAVLQMLADQVATALSNAQLFSENQQALEAARRAYGEMSFRAWNELSARPDWGYQYLHQTIGPTEAEWPADMVQAIRIGERVLGQDQTGATLALPLKIRGQIVGVLSFAKGTPGETWTTEEMSLLENLVDQLGTALDSARLYQETQRRAARERLTGEITARIRETLDMDAMLQTAAQQVREALGTSEVVIRLVPQPTHPAE